MKKTHVIYGLLVSLVIFACTQNRTESKENESAAMSVSNSEEKTMAFSANQVVDALPKTQVENAFPSEKKIIYEGSIEAESIEISKTKKYIDEVLSKHQAYYEKEDLEDNSFKLAFSLKIRIPFKNFKKFISDLEKGKFKILKKSITANDVTEEFVDIGIRLENKKAYLERYKKLLDKAGSIKSIIEIEEIIRALEEEIESSEGRLRYLGDQSAYSTLDMTLSQDKKFIEPVKFERSFGEKFVDSLSTGWNSILTFFLNLLSIWPYLLLLWGAYFLGKKMWKKYVK